VPRNPFAVFEAGWPALANQTRTIDLLTGYLFFLPLLDGVDFPANPFEHGRLYAVLQGSSDGGLVGDTQYDAVLARMLLGTYRIAYEYLAGASVPQNTFGFADETLAANPVAPEVAAPVDFTTGELAAEFTHNGAPIDFDASQSLTVELRSGLDRVDLYANLSIELGIGISRQILEGRYDVFYRYEAGADLPLNNEQPIGCLILSAP
jgi:hypothetical protein